jgi:hypothetical protein
MVILRALEENIQNAKGTKYAKESIISAFPAFFMVFIVVFMVPLSKITVEYAYLYGKNVISGLSPSGA